MRLLICAGGTGGGVYPALAVLRAIEDSAEVLWIGGEGGMETQLIERSGIPFRTIPAAGVHGIGLRTLPGNLWQLGRGVFASRRILREFKPDVLFFTGGYVAVPMALAGWKLPSLLYVPDIEPGLALKALSRLASRIGLTTETSSIYFPGNSRTSVTGYPTRPELSGWDRVRGCAHLALDASRSVLLVTGGSKGARSINRALLASLPELLKITQVIHISGQLDWPEVETSAQNLAPELASNYHPMPYLHEMGAALASADLVISRAGASSLGEYPLFGLPAVLVPYPYAWRYQKINAAYLVEKGAAVMIADADLSSAMQRTVPELLTDKPRLEGMRTQMLSLARPQAANELAGLVRQLAEGGAS